MRIEVEGRSLLGHLDTGGAFIAMSPRMAEELGIVVHETGTGVANNRETRVLQGLATSVRLGDALLRNVPVVALDALSGVAQGQEIEDLVIVGTALLSHGFLKHFVWTIDFERHVLYLSPVDGGSGSSDGDAQEAISEP